MPTTIPTEIAELQTGLVPLFDGKKRSDIPREHGIYCFWWKVEGNDHQLPEATDALFQGAFVGAERIEAEGLTEDELLRKGNKAYHRLCGPLRGTTSVPCPLKGYTCLYVGKSDELKGVYGRVGKHVCRNTLTRSAYLRYKLRQEAPVTQQHYVGDGPEQILKRNTSSQFRAGLEYLFRNEAEDFAYSRMKDSVYVSWINDNEMTFRDRFYLEDLAIGLFHPWFNLDSER